MHKNCQKFTENLDKAEVDRHNLQIYILKTLQMSSQVIPASDRLTFSKKNLFYGNFLVYFICSGYCHPDIVIASVAVLVQA